MGRTRSLFPLSPLRDWAVVSLLVEVVQDRSYERPQSAAWDRLYDVKEDAEESLMVRMGRPA